MKKNMSGYKMAFLKRNCVKFNYFYNFSEEVQYSSVKLAFIFVANFC